MSIRPYARALESFDPFTEDRARDTRIRESLETSRQHDSNTLAWIADQERELRNRTCGEMK